MSASSVCPEECLRTHINHLLFALIRSRVLFPPSPIGFEACIDICPFGSIGQDAQGEGEFMKLDGYGCQHRAERGEAKREAEEARVKAAEMGDGVDRHNGGKTYLLPLWNSYQDAISEIVSYTIAGSPSLWPPSQTPIGPG